jgi:cell division septum initiation protein DivIVA
MTGLEVLGSGDPDRIRDFLIDFIAEETERYRDRIGELERDIAHAEEQLDSCHDAIDRLTKRSRDINEMGHDRLLDVAGLSFEPTKEMEAMRAEQGACRTWDQWRDLNDRYQRAAVRAVCEGMARRIMEGR